LVIMRILPIDWDSNESVIASDCSYTDECQLTGDEFVGRYTCFGSIVAGIHDQRTGRQLPH